MTTIHPSNPPPPPFARFARGSRLEWPLYHSVRAAAHGGYAPLKRLPLQHSLLHLGREGNDIRAVLLHLACGDGNGVRGESKVVLGRVALHNGGAVAVSPALKILVRLYITRLDLTAAEKGREGRVGTPSSQPV